VRAEYLASWRASGLPLRRWLVNGRLLHGRERQREQRIRRGLDEAPLEGEPSLGLGGGGGGLRDVAQRDEDAGRGARLGGEQRRGDRDSPATGAVFS
jgi:hypothetical protein